MTLVDHHDSASLDALLDEMLDHYITWRGEAKAVAAAYRNWSGAAPDDHLPRFSAYLAALDREEAAATTYAIAARTVERVLQQLAVA